MFVMFLKKIYDKYVLKKRFKSGTRCAYHVCINLYRYKYISHVSMSVCLLLILV